MHGRIQIKIVNYLEQPNTLIKKTKIWSMQPYPFDEKQENFLFAGVI